MTVSVRLTGIEGVQAELRAIVPKLRIRALRNALAAGARLVQREAQRLTPVLKLSTYSGASAARRGVRKVGTVKKAISVRTSSRARKRGDVGVFVNVRPAKGANRGGKNPNDPFYWRWLEFGWNPNNGAGTRAARRARKKEGRRLNSIGAAKRKPGAAFLRGAVKMLPAALRVFESKIKPAIAKLNQRKAPAP